LAAPSSANLAGHSRGHARCGEPVEMVHVRGVSYVAPSPKPADNCALLDQRRRRVNRTSAFFGYLAVVLLSSWVAMAFVPAALHATEGDRTSTGGLRLAAQIPKTPTRRSLILGAPFIAASPAGAVFGIGEGLTPVTVGDFYNISIPGDFKVKSRLTGDVEFSGDPVQKLEGMSCGYKTVKRGSLAEVNPDPMALANKVSTRSYGNSTVVSAKAAQVGGGDAYIIEYENQLIHESLLVACLKSGTEGKECTLCTVSIRTPSLGYPLKKDTFDKMINSFQPLR